MCLIIVEQKRSWAFLGIWQYYFFQIPEHNSTIDPSRIAKVRKNMFCQFFSLNAKVCFSLIYPGEREFPTSSSDCGHNCHILFHQFVLRFQTSAAADCIPSARWHLN